MKDRVFFDTNLLIYLYSNDELNKKQRIIDLFEKNNALISTQVLNEFSNVLLKKFKLSTFEVRIALEEIESCFEIVQTDILTIKKSLEIKSNYLFSYYDCLIISSAFFNGCKTLYSEDLNHGQLIENKMAIINPFK